MSKAFIFLLKSFLGNFYRNLAIFIWSVRFVSFTNFRVELLICSARKFSDWMVQVKRMISGNQSESINSKQCSVIKFVNDMDLCSQSYKRSKILNYDSKVTLTVNF